MESYDRKIEGITPGIAEQIQYISDCQKALGDDMQKILEDDDEGEEGKLAELERMDNMLRSIKENLIAVRNWEAGIEREKAKIQEGIERQVLQMMDANIDEQIAYTESRITMLTIKLDVDALRIEKSILITLQTNKWFVKAIADYLSGLPSNEPTNINEEIGELVTALTQAVDILKGMAQISLGDGRKLTFDFKAIQGIEAVLNKYAAEELAHV